jgi:hypothetical protein
LPFRNGWIGVINCEAYSTFTARILCLTLLITRVKDVQADVLAAVFEVLFIKRSLAACLKPNQYDTGFSFFEHFLEHNSLRKTWLRD